MQHICFYACFKIKLDFGMNNYLENFSDYTEIKAMLQPGNHSTYGLRDLLGGVILTSHLNFTTCCW